jgi:hypothetical protein
MVNSSGDRTVAFFVHGLHFALASAVNSVESMSDDSQALLFLQRLFVLNMNNILNLRGALWPFDEIWHGSVDFGPVVPIVIIETYATVVARFSRFGMNEGTDLNALARRLLHVKWVAAVTHMALRLAEFKFCSEPRPHSLSSIRLATHAVQSVFLSMVDVEISSIRERLLRHEVECDVYPTMHASFFGAGGSPLIEYHTPRVGNSFEVYLGVPNAEAGSMLRTSRLRVTGAESEDDSWQASDRSSMSD